MTRHVVIAMALLVQTPLLAHGIPQGAHCFVNVRKLKVSFTRRATLFIANDLNDRSVLHGLPSKIGDQLYWTDGHTVKVIHTLMDLEGHVRIRDAGAALAYVRLRTAPSTFHVYRDSLWAEVLRFGDVTPDILFGLNDLDVRVWLRSRYDGGGGIVSDETYQDLRVRPPIVSALPQGGYRIKRAVVVQEFGKGRKPTPQWVVEDVTSRGSYKVVKHLPLLGVEDHRVNWELASGK